MTKRNLYGSAALILAVAWFHGAVSGILATIVAGGVYLASCRLNPRARHWRCQGTGEFRGTLFRHAHRQCPGCRRGRVIRWGARYWGPAHVRTEHVATRRAVAAAREGRRWR